MVNAQTRGYHAAMSDDPYMLSEQKISFKHGTIKAAVNCLSFLTEASHLILHALTHRFDVNTENGYNSSYSLSLQLDALETVLYSSINGSRMIGFSSGYTQSIYDICNKLHTEY